MSNQSTNFSSQHFYIGIYFFLSCYSPSGLVLLASQAIILREPSLPFPNPPSNPGLRQWFAVSLPHSLYVVPAHGVPNLELSNAWHDLTFCGGGRGYRDEKRWG